MGWEGLFREGLDTVLRAMDFFSKLLGVGGRTPAPINSSGFKSITWTRLLAGQILALDENFLARFQPVGFRKKVDKPGFKHAPSLINRMRNIGI